MRFYLLRIFVIFKKTLWHFYCDEIVKRCQQRYPCRCWNHVALKCPPKSWLFLLRIFGYGFSLFYRWVKETFQRLYFMWLLYGQCNHIFLFNCILHQKNKDKSHQNSPTKVPLYTPYISNHLLVCDWEFFYCVLETLV